MQATPLTALAAIRERGIVVASDTAEYHQIGEFNPRDATTNPSLVLAAVIRPEYNHLVDKAVQYALSRRSSESIESQTQLALDYLLVQVGIQILSLIPGRVSVSIDPRLAYDQDAIVSKGRELISIFEELGVRRQRVLIKIPATYPGILAARTLEAPIQLPDGTAVPAIHTNATLIFGLVQALACAQAGMCVISPFIGRVKDWWAVHEANTGVSNKSTSSSDQPLSEHPGILLVQRIRSAYTSYGHQTEIMAAGFRSVDEVVELGKRGSRGGPDIVTLPPNLLEGLRKRNGVIGHDHIQGDVKQRPEPRYISAVGALGVEEEAAYAADLEKEMIVLDKVPEGLAKFAVDAKRLEDLIKERVESNTEVPARL